jgi:hypothetical protein
LDSERSSWFSVTLFRCIVLCLLVLLDWVSHWLDLSKSQSKGAEFDNLQKRKQVTKRQVLQLSVSEKQVRLTFLWILFLF